MTFEVSICAQHGTEILLILSILLLSQPGQLRGGARAEGLQMETDPSQRHIPAFCHSSVLEYSGNPEHQLLYCSSTCGY